MFRVISFLKRNPAISREEFLSYWFDVHTPRLLVEPVFKGRLKRYVVSRAFDVPPPEIPDIYDAVTELWFDNRHDAIVVLEEESRTTDIRPQAIKRMDLPGSAICCGDAVVVHDSGPIGVKLVMASLRAPGWTREEAQRYWSDVHLPLSRTATAFWTYITRYTQIHARPSSDIVLSGARPYDLLAEIGLAGLAQMRAALADPQYLALVKPDELKFSRVDQTLAFAGEGEVVYHP